MTPLRSQRQALMWVLPVAGAFGFAGVGYRCIGIFISSSEGRQKGFCHSQRMTALCVYFGSASLPIIIKLGQAKYYPLKVLQAVSGLLIGAGYLHHSSLWSREPRRPKSLRASAKENAYTQDSKPNCGPI
jgi:hypothetical protein